MSKLILNHLRLLLYLMTCVLVLSGCNQKVVQYSPGVYSNKAEGYYSILKVEVEVNQYQILDIKIISHEEPQILADIVFEKLPPKIIKANSTDVDTISGATYTSKALLEAVEKALQVAKEGTQ